MAPTDHYLTPKTQRIMLYGKVKNTNHTVIQMWKEQLTYLNVCQQYPILLQLKISNGYANVLEIHSRMGQISY